VTPIAALKDLTASGHATATRFSARGGLVAAQVAVSLLLVIAAGLFIRTFDRLLAVPLGFDSDRVLVVEIDASRTPSASGSRTDLYRRDRIRRRTDSWCRVRRGIAQHTGQSRRHARG
jgi:hypothetical protein